MGYLIAIVLSIALFSSFLILTSYETTRGTRLFAGSRQRLDAKVSRAVFVIRHVDWGAWLRELVRTTSDRVMHDVAEGTLALVRIVERMLTRTVRYLRERRHTPAEARREWSLSHAVLDLRKHLRRPTRRTDAPTEE